MATGKKKPFKSNFAKVMEEYMVKGSKKPKKSKSCQRGTKSK